ncbi:MAG: HNH endonuclease [Nitrospirota bacterium]
MAISKKIRFEVFKRDGFACAYCGKTPPSVTLEVDHIDPKSKGGSNDLNNLITACFDCNRGKRNVPLNKIPAKLNENIEILKMQEEQIREYRKYVKKVEERISADIEEIDSIFTEQYKDYQLSDTFKNVSLKRFINLLPKHEIIESMYIAISKYPAKSKHNEAIRYFCGVCWTKIKRQSENGQE